MKNQRGHWVGWMSTSKKNIFWGRTHTSSVRADSSFERYTRTQAVRPRNHDTEMLHCHAVSRADMPSYWIRHVHTKASNPDRHVYEEQIERDKENIINQYKKEVVVPPQSLVTDKTKQYEYNNINRTRPTAKGKDRKTEAQQKKHLGGTRRSLCYE